MKPQEIIRSKQVVKLLTALNPQYSNCHKCGLPWNCCESKSVMVTEDTGIFAVCTHCWNNSTLSDLKKYHGQVWQERVQSAKMVWIDLGYSLPNILDAVEKEFEKTNSNEKLLAEHGWVVECQSPFEIRYEDGGAFASGLAANIVLDYYKNGENF